MPAPRSAFRALIKQRFVGDDGKEYRRRSLSGDATWTTWKLQIAQDSLSAIIGANVKPYDTSNMLLDTEFDDADYWTFFTGFAGANGSDPLHNGDGLILPKGGWGEVAFKRALAESLDAAAMKEEIAARLEAAEKDAAKRQLRAWAGLCQALFAGNEFVYVD